MRKEVWLAILGGILLGLIIGFGVWRVNSAFKTQNPQTSPSPTPINPGQFGLTIAKPNYDDVITNSSVNISGLTSGGSYVVITNDTTDYIIQADSQGVFNFDVDVDGGVNFININAVDKSGNTIEKDLRLVYSSQLATPSSSPSPTPSASDNSSTSESQIRDSVLKKVQEVLSSPKAYIGTVTDIAENTIQIKSDSGEILQVSTKPDDITVIKSDDTNKEVKFSDIAIGDYIVAMGFNNDGNHVLNAKRILIITPLTASTNKVFIGKIKTINNNEITLINLKDGKDIPTSMELGYLTRFTTTKDGKTIAVKFSTLGENDIVIITGATKKDTFTARRVHLVESAP